MRLAVAAVRGLEQADDRLDADPYLTQCGAVLVEGSGLLVERPGVLIECPGVPVERAGVLVERAGVLVLRQVQRLQQASLGAELGVEAAEVPVHGAEQLLVAVEPLLVLLVHGLQLTQPDLDAVAPFREFLKRDGHAVLLSVVPSVLGDKSSGNLWKRKLQLVAIGDATNCQLRAAITTVLGLASLVADRDLAAVVGPLGRAGEDGGLASRDTAGGPGDGGGVEQVVFRRAGDPGREGEAGGG